jgi:hypothetical protein
LNNKVGSVAPNQIANFNTGVGSKSLLANVSGLRNTAVGFSSLSSTNPTTVNPTTTGNDNTGVGYQAGFTVSGGRQNTFIGSGADVSASALFNATAIGYNAKVDNNNKVRIGNDFVTNVELPPNSSLSIPTNPPAGVTIITSGSASNINGDLNVTGMLTKGSGTFKIDHPLDPENKYLYHSFVESPDMMNIYNGNAVLDSKGEATVVLPEWFEALNKDFRYQLTAIGGFAPVYIASEISRNTFKIGGGKPGLKVSWQITGIRKDPYAELHRTPVEENKPEGERGTYLYPEAYGKPAHTSTTRPPAPVAASRSKTKGN